MEEPALQFTEEPYDEEWIKEMLEGFRTKGYAVLPNVFKRETVDPFLEQLKSATYDAGVEWRMPDDIPHHVWASQAPRVRQILVPTLTHTQAAGIPSMCNTMWIITPHNRPDLVPDWHKDREPEGMPGNEYHYPIDVFVGFYFEDLSEERGPLKVIPGSHWDGMITPHTDHPHETIMCKKEDGVLLDQRVWHRGTPRSIPGLRVLVVYAYYLVPVHYGCMHKMPRIQREIWMKQTRRDDLAFWGGTFHPPREEEPIPQG